MDWISSPVVGVLLAAALTFVGALLSILVHQLIRKIEHIDNRMSNFITREEVDTKLDRVRVDIDKQIIRQEDRITKRLDAIAIGVEDMRTWLMEQMGKIINHD